MALLIAFLQRVHRKMAQFLSRGAASGFLKKPLPNLKTEFRANVLNRIYCAALGLCNGRLECAEVTLGTSAEEEGWPVFDLIITWTQTGII